MELARPREWYTPISDAEVAEALEFLREPAAYADDVPAVVGLDIETGGLRARHDPLCTAQLANAEAAFAIPYKDISPTAQQAIRAFLVEHDRRPPLVAHNASFEWCFWRESGAEIEAGLLDTMVLEQVLTAGLAADVGLEDTVGRRLHQDMPKHQQTAFWMAHHSKYTPQMWEYAATDAHILIPLYASQYRELRRAKLLEIADLEMACVIPYSRMGSNGVCIDREAMAALAQQKKTEAEALVPDVVQALASRRQELGLPGYNQLLPLGDAYAEVDLGFSLTSPTELGRELVQLGVPLEQTEDSKKTPHKKPVYSTDKKALKECSLDLPFLVVLADYSIVSTEASDAKKILELIDPATGRCYPSFQQNRCATGRSSTTNPNAQNVPRSKTFRQLFIPGPNPRQRRSGKRGMARRFVLCDYGQVELRVVAQITRDPVMLATYNDPDGDLHRRTAAVCNSIAESEVSGEARRGAKGVNFGLVFGMRPAKLRQTCFEQYSFRMTEEESTLFSQRYFEEYAAVADWHARIEHGLRNGDFSQVVSIGGRRRLLPEDDRRLQLVANTFVQSVAASIMKLAVSRMEAAFAEMGLESAQLVNVVHDELLVEVDEDEADLCMEIVSAVMCDAELEYLPDVPPEAEAKVAISWADK